MIFSKIFPQIGRREMGLIDISSLRQVQYSFAGFSQHLWSCSLSISSRTGWLRLFVNLNVFQRQRQLTSMQETEVRTKGRHPYHCAGRTHRLWLTYEALTEPHVRRCNTELTVGPLTLNRPGFSEWARPGGADSSLPPSLCNVPI